MTFETCYEIDKIKTLDFCVKRIPGYLGKNSVKGRKINLIAQESIKSIMEIEID